MSHTTDIGLFTFQHDGDMTGDVTIQPYNKDQEVTIPVAYLEQFIALKRQNNILTRIEELDLKDPEVHLVLSNVDAVLTNWIGRNDT